MLLATLPVHPQPFEDELLSSWIVRLAHGNGFKVQTLSALYFGREKSLWTRDIDHHAPTWLLERLAGMSGLSRKRLERMTLRSYEGRVYERLNPTGATRFLLPLAVYHRVRRGFGLQYCARCLAADAQPHYRKRWRLSLSCICCEHAVFLRDRCPFCAQPVTPHRIDMTTRGGVPHERSLWRCAHCRGDLRRGASSRAAAELVAVQRRFDSAADAGFAFVGGTAPIYSHLFFNGLRALAHGVDRARTSSERLSKIDSADATRRMRLWSEADELTHEWPERLVAWCAGVPHAYSILNNADAEIPYWVASVLRERVYAGRAKVSVAEATSILSAAKNAGLHGTARARNLSGRDVQRFVAQPCCSVEAADALLASLTREIKSASGERRWLLHRDRVMFLLGRELGLCVPQLLALVWQVDGGVGSPRSEDRPTPLRPASEQAVEGLINSQGLVAAGRLPGRPVFITARGRTLKASAVGERFRRAVRSAGLTEEIPDWKQWIRTVPPSRAGRAV